MPGERPAERALGVLVGSSSVGGSKVCLGSPEGKNCVLGSIKQHHQLVRREDRLLCSALVWPHLVCWEQFRASQFKDLKVLEGKLLKKFLKSGSHQTDLLAQIECVTW